jgi:hypothetical protein
MVEIKQIIVMIKTGDVGGAGTDGKVYLGIGGREFRVDKLGNQFQRNNLDTFTIGLGSDIENPDNVNSLPSPTGNKNAPNIEDVDIEFSPKYLRFNPNSDDDNWNVQHVQVEVIDIGKTYQGPRDGNIRLGTRSGLTINLS